MRETLAEPFTRNPLMAMLCLALVWTRALIFHGAGSKLAGSASCLTALEGAKSGLELLSSNLECAVKTVSSTLLLGLQRLDSVTVDRLLVFRLGFVNWTRGAFMLSDDILIRLNPTGGFLWCLGYVGGAVVRQ